jgi:Protein of unknown function (DUF4229)
VKEFLVYTGLRLALFAGSLGIIVGIWSVVSPDGSVQLLWAMALAFLVSGVASYFLLNAHRERFARKVSERAARASAAFDQRRAAEDAADEPVSPSSSSSPDAEDAALPPEDRRS